MMDYFILCAMLAWSGVGRFIKHVHGGQVLGD